MRGDFVAAWMNLTASARWCRNRAAPSVGVAVRVGADAASHECERDGECRQRRDRTDADGDAD